MKWVICAAAALLAGSVIREAHGQLYFPDVAGSAMNGYRQGQEQRQRQLDYQAQIEYLRGQQQLRALSAEFWASDDARKWQLLPEIAAIDPVLAGQYQASIDPPAEVTNSVLYKCPKADGSIEFTAIPADGCTVIAANPGQ